MYWIAVISWCLRGKKQNAHKSSLGEKWTDNFHACMSWIYQQNPHHDPYTFSTFALHHSKHPIQMYLIHNTTTSASTSTSKQPKLKEYNSPSSWEQTPHFSWSLNLNPKPPQLRVWKVSSHHESAQPQLELHSQAFVKVHSTVHWNILAQNFAKQTVTFHVFLFIPDLQFFMFACQIFQFLTGFCCHLWCWIFCSCILCLSLLAAGIISFINLASCSINCFL